MNIGSHLPIYVFFEQFVEGKRVLDLYPPDNLGTQFLSRSARSTVSVHSSSEAVAPTGEEEENAVIAPVNQLPFRSDSFDLVVFFARKESARLPSIVEFLKSARVLVGQQGLICVAIPNRDARGLEDAQDNDLPRYFDFERAMRRQFPHVIMLASKPLHGGVVSSIGRGDGTVAPLLEDRLLPEGGEIPSHFIGVCSLRYQRVDDSMIVQAPNEILVDPIREKIDQLRSNLSIAMSESELRARELKKLEDRIDEMKEKMELAELIKHEKASALALLKDAQRQIETKNKVQEEFAKTNEKLLVRIAEFEQELFEAERKFRKEEQKKTELEKKIALSVKERQSAEDERENLVSALRSAKAETRARQRDLDDAREELAGAEVDLSALREEVERQRRETFQARERATKLDLKLMDAVEHRADTASFEAELDRIRKTSASERERLERLLEEEHNRLLEEIENCSKANKRVHELQKKVEQTEVLVGEAGQRSEILGERLQRALEQIEGYEKERRGARKNQHEIERLAQARSDEIDRCKHQMEILSSRAAQSERRESELKKQCEELNKGLESTEAKLSELKKFKEIALKEAKEQKARIAKLTQDLKAQGDESSKLEQELEELETKLKKAGAKQIEIESAQALREKLERATEKNSRLIDEISSVKSSLEYEKDQVRAEAERAEEAEIKERKTLERTVELEDELDKASDRTAAHEEEIATYKTDLDDMHGQIFQLESALADAEDDRRQFKRSTDRLLAEMEEELLMVSDDLEKELRLAATRYEKAQGEIWELKEEIVRLRAHEAAVKASDKRAEKDVNEAIKKQEAIIAKLTKERNELRKTCEKYQKALKNAKRDRRPQLTKPRPGESKTGNSKSEKSKIGKSQPKKSPSEKARPNKGGLEISKSMKSKSEEK